jgi:hypothetical protein
MHAFHISVYVKLSDAFYSVKENVKNTPPLKHIERNGETPLTFAHISPCPPPKFLSGTILQIIDTEPFAKCDGIGN